MRRCAAPRCRGEGSIKRVRAGRAADLNLVGNQAVRRIPVVQQIGGRAYMRLWRGVCAELQRDLGRRARTADDDGAGPAPYHEAVYMAAEHGLDIRKPPQPLFEFWRVDVAISIHVVDARHEGRVVQQNQGGGLRLGRQRVLKPL